MPPSSHFYMYWYLYWIEIWFLFVPRYYQHYNISLMSDDSRFDRWENWELLKDVYILPSYFCCKGFFVKVNWKVYSKFTINYMYVFFFKVVVRTLDSFFYIKFHSKSLGPIHHVHKVPIMKTHVRKKMESQPTMTYP